MKTLYSVLIVLLLVSFSCYGTPSTQIWNPSTDIQGEGAVHLGIDNYFTIVWPQDGGYSFPTNIGLTYGLMPGIEVGIDGFYPSSTQYMFNAKYGLAETDALPAFAIGGMNFGFDKISSTKSADPNISYAVIAKTFDIGRFTTGYYTGNENVLVNIDGDKASTGYILTWDKAISKKLWACIDYASGYSSYGSAFYGVSWVFAENTSIIFGYGTYNNGAKPTVTTQIDINI